MADTVRQEAPEALPEGYPERIPEFASEQEAREFWDTHDSTYYWDQMEDVTHNPPPQLRRGPGREGSRARKRPDAEHMDLVQLIMHEDTIAALKKLAAARHVSYQVLVKSWIEERLAQEQHASS